MNGGNKGFYKKGLQLGLLPSAMILMLVFLMSPGIVRGMEEPAAPKVRSLTAREKWQEKVEKAKEREKASFFAKAIPGVAASKGIEAKGEPDWLLKMRTLWIDAGVDEKEINERATRVMESLASEKSEYDAFEMLKRILKKRSTKDSIEDIEVIVTEAIKKQDPDVSNDFLERKTSNAKVQQAVKIVYDKIIQLETAAGKVGLDIDKLATNSSTYQEMYNLLSDLDVAIDDLKSEAIGQSEAIFEEEKEVKGLAKDVIKEADQAGSEVEKTLKKFEETGNPQAVAAGVSGLVANVDKASSANAQIPSEQARARTDAVRKTVAEVKKGTPAPAPAKGKKCPKGKIRRRGKCVKKKKVGKKKKKASVRRKGTRRK